MKTMCTPQNNTRGMIFSIIFSTIVYFLGMLLIDLLLSNSIGNIPNKIHEYSGFFSGFSTDGSEKIQIYSILFSIGILVGVSNNSIIEGILSILLFEIIQIVIFFSIGLLYLGNHYDYNELFQDYISSIILPFCIMSISMIIGYFGIKRQPKHLIQLSNF